MGVVHSDLTVRATGYTIGFLLSIILVFKIIIPMLDLEAAIGNSCQQNASALFNVLQLALSCRKQEHYGRVILYDVRTCRFCFGTNRCILKPSILRTRRTYCHIPRHVFSSSLYREKKRQDFCRNPKRRDNLRVRSFGLWYLESHTPLQS